MDITKKDIKVLGRIVSIATEVGNGDNGIVADAAQLYDTVQKDNQENINKKLNNKIDALESEVDSINLDNYYTKDQVYSKGQTYNKAEVDSLIHQGEPSSILNVKEINIDDDGDETVATLNANDQGGLNVESNGQITIDSDTAEDYGLFIDTPAYFEQNALFTGNVEFTGEVTGITVDVPDPLSVSSFNIKDPNTDNTMLQIGYDSVETASYIHPDGVPLHLSGDVIATTAFAIPLTYVNNPSEGSIYFDSLNSQLKVWNGSEYIDFHAGDYYQVMTQALAGYYAKNEAISTDNAISANNSLVVKGSPNSSAKLTINEETSALSYPGMKIECQTGTELGTSLYVNADTVCTYFTLPNLSTDAPREGQVYFDSYDHKLYVYDGSNWYSLTLTPEV